MQSFKMLSAIAAGAVFVASLSGVGAAYAQAPAYRGEAKLVSATSAPRTETISGVAWTCDGAECVGTARQRQNLDGLVRECKKVVAVVGPVAAYKSGARELSDGQIRACNKGAAEVQTASK